LIAWKTSAHPRDDEKVLFHLAALAAQAHSELAAEVDERGRTHALVIDESHLRDHGELDAIRMLTN